MCIDDLKNFVVDIIQNIYLSLTSFINMNHIIDDNGPLVNNENDRLQQYEKVHNEAKELFRKKNADYGDAFSQYGAIGVVIRIGDKISRLNNIKKTQIINVDNETLRDTLVDLHNYSAMAIMLMDEE
tara:strand:- start:166 stop:546 length:381 start_codon:yes stop_codon:yes gene_type:complete